MSGGTRGRQGKDCFSGLYAKLLQMDPNAAIPTPPVGRFAGDSVAFTASVVNGQVRIEASKANAAGVTTEFLFQELPSEVALSNPKGFHTADFHRFTNPVTAEVLTVPPGFYEFAAQFVEIATGRVAGFASLGRLTVGLSVMRGGADDAEDEGLAKVA